MKRWLMIRCALLVGFVIWPFIAALILAAAAVMCVACWVAIPFSTVKRENGSIKIRFFWECL